MSNVEKFLENKNWAVVGVSPNKFKFGYKIWSILKKNGYNVYAVNPFYDEVDGEKIYSSLSDIDAEIDVIDIVVPPDSAIDYIEEAGKLGIENIWFQPDTYNDEVINKTEKLNINHINDDCVLKVLTEKSLS